MTPVRGNRAGLIGAGLLGSALAERLVQAGFSLWGYDVDRKRCEALRRIGATVAPDAGAVARAAPRVILSLPESSTVERVTGELQPALTAESIIIDTTTGDPERVTVLAARLAAGGVRYLDAAISGSSTEARRGEVIVVAGGDRAAFDACRDIFATFARRAFHVGPCGNGTRMKLVTNLVLGLNRAVLAEGLGFASALGIDPAAALAILLESSAFSRVMETKGKKMLQSEFSPEARLAQHHKDVRLILDAGAAAEAVLPLSELHHRLLESAEALGWGDADNSSIIEVFRRHGGQPADS